MRCEGRELRVVVDTNVWVSGLIVRPSPPAAIIDAIRERLLTPVASWELAHELVDVLRRPKLARYHFGEDDVRDLLLLIGPTIPAVEVAVDIRDPDDAPVVAAALAGSAKAIVTGDRDLLVDLALVAWLRDRGIDVLTPVKLLDRLA